MQGQVFVFSKKQEELHVEIAEILRYLGYIKCAQTSRDEEQAKAVLESARTKVFPKACYIRLPIELLSDNRINLPYSQIISEKLSINLKGCKEIFLIAATIGPQFDMAQKMAKVRSITEAAYYQAIGATFVEAMVEEVVKRLESLIEPEGLHLRPRFSPGFGDFDLDNQRDIFSYLCPEKNIGLTLNESLVMAPEKSVTAVIGIY